MSILDNAKELATAVHEIKNLDLYERVLNLNAGIMDIVEENRSLHAEIENLKKKLELQAKMSFKVPFYFQEGDETPYCSSCWEANNQAIHLKSIHDTRWDCPACKNTYLTETTRKFRAYGGGREPGPWS